MGWAQGIRELKDEEKNKIYSYLKKYNSESYYDDIINDDYDKMDFLEFSEKDERGEKTLNSNCAIFQYAYTD